MNIDQQSTSNPSKVTSWAPWRPPGREGFSKTSIFDDVGSILGSIGKPLGPLAKPFSHLGPSDVDFGAQNASSFTNLDFTSVFDRFLMHFWVPPDPHTRAEKREHRLH